MTIMRPHTFSPAELDKAAAILGCLDLARSAQELLLAEARRIEAIQKARCDVVNTIAAALDLTPTTTPTKTIAEDLLDIIEKKGWRQP